MAMTPNTVIRNALRKLWMQSSERNEALKRTGYCCEKCGVKRSVAKSSEVIIHVHHLDEPNWDLLIEAVRKYLLHKSDRLQVLCKPCHLPLRKRSKKDD